MQTNSLIIKNKQIKKPFLKLDEILDTLKKNIFKSKNKNKIKKIKPDDNLNHTHRTKYCIGCSKGLKHESIDKLNNCNSFMNGYFESLIQNKISFKPLKSLKK